MANFEEEMKSWGRLGLKTKGDFVMPFKSRKLSKKEADKIIKEDL